MRRPRTGLWVACLVFAALAVLIAMRPWRDEPAVERGSSENAPGPDTPVLQGRSESQARPPAAEATRQLHVKVVRGYEDTAIPNAAVRVLKPNQQTVILVTGTDGVATMAGLPPGVLRVVANAEGYAISEEKEVREEWNPDGDVLIRLEPAGPLRGQIVDAADGRPVTGVKVTAMGGGALCVNPFPPQRFGRVFGETKTGSDGRFVIETVSRQPSCSLRLVRVEAPGYRTLWKVAPPDGEDAHFVIRLVPGGSISGTVTAQGVPVAGAKVVCLLSGPRGGDPTLFADRIGLPDRFTNRVEWAGQEAAVHVVEDAWAALTAETDEAGRYEIRGLGLGERYAVAARAPGHAPSDRTYPVRLTSEDRRRRVDLALREPCRLRVFCQDADGEPWPGISIQIEPLRHGPDIAEQKTDERGFARFDNLTPGEFYVRAWEYRGGGGTLQKVQGHAGEMDLTLTVDGEQPQPRPPPRPSAESETKENEAEEPPPEPEREPTLVARLAVPHGVTPPKYVRLSGRYKNGGGHGGTEWTPDGTGTVLVEWTWENLKYTFVIEAPGFLPIRRQVNRSPGSVADLGTLTLDPGATLRGVVRTPDGTPLPGVTVEVSHPARDKGTGSSFWDRMDEPEDALVRECETAADGTFSLAGLPRDAVSIEMRDPRFLPFHSRIQPLPLRTPLEVVVSLGSTLRVRAEDHDGHPATRRHVAIRRVGEDDDFMAYGRTNVEGVFTARLEAGKYRIEVGTRYSGDKDQTVHLVELEDGASREVRLTAPKID